MNVMDPSDEDYPSSGPPTTARQQPVRQDPTPTPILTDEQIEDYRSFYSAHIDRLVAFLQWSGADFAEAADIAQETMAKAYHRWDSLTNPAGWIRTVAYRMFIRIRTEIREDPTDEIASDEPRSSLLAKDAPADAFVDNDSEREFLQLLQGLPPRQRQVMAWTYDGYSPTEIATELSTPQSPLSAAAVRASLKLARRNLVKRLNQRKDAE